MKKVIVRLRECGVNKIRTIRKRYYYSLSQYKSEVFDDFKDMMPGQEIWIKIGTSYSKFYSYEEVLEDSAFNKTLFDEELEHQLLSDYSVNYNLKQYLPKY